MSALPDDEVEELWIALRRLRVKAWEFQREAQNFDKTDTTDHHLTVAIQLADEVLHRTCPHLEWKGVDLVAIDNPTKQWRCTRCDALRVGL